MIRRMYKDDNISLFLKKRLFVLVCYIFICICMLVWILYTSLYIHGDFTIFINCYNDLKLSRPVESSSFADVCYRKNDWLSTGNYLATSEVYKMIHKSYGHHYLIHSSFCGSYKGSGGINELYFNSFPKLLKIPNLMTWHGWPVFESKGRIYIQAPLSGLLSLDKFIGIPLLDYKLDSSVSNTSLPTVNKDKSNFILAITNNVSVAFMFMIYYISLNILCMGILHIFIKYKFINHSIYIYILSFITVTIFAYFSSEFLVSIYGYNCFVGKFYDNITPTLTRADVEKVSTHYLRSSEFWVTDICKYINSDMCKSLYFPLYGKHYLCHESCGGYSLLYKTFFQNMGLLSNLDNILTYRGFPLYVLNDIIFVELPIEEALRIDSVFQGMGRGIKPPTYIASQWEKMF